MLSITDYHSNLMKILTETTGRLRRVRRAGIVGGLVIIFS
jgi:hypothetical protein